MNSKLPTSNYEAVDLGLPSGTLWADRNLGASSETEAGLYFAWGETTGYVDGNARNTALGLTGGFDATAYTATGASSISSDLTLAQDAAYTNMGGLWRMPTELELLELVNTSYTDTEWTTINGVKGKKFMKKSDHSVYVFFPADSCWSGMSHDTRMLNGRYWVNKYNRGSNTASFLFINDSHAFKSTGYGGDGYTIRAVMNQPELET